MNRSFVEKHGKSFVVKTAKITSWGFTNIRKTDSFDSLEEAQAKAKLCNYIWQKCKETTITLSFLILLCGCFETCRAQEIDTEKLATAIYHAEGGAKTSHPYGILAHYKHTSPRQAAINTINHAKRDWNGQGDFIAFLGSRYCPVGAKNDPTGLNVNWYKNVSIIYGRIK